MKLNDILNEDKSASPVQWDYGDDDRVKTLNSLIKYNNGIWKSVKQRDFLTGPRGPMGGDFHSNGHQRRDYEFLDKHFGVKPDKSKDEYVISVGGYIRWADYGAKSRRSIGFMYVMDKLGVVSKYKLGWTYEGTAGAIDRSKTKLEWERPKHVEDSAKENLETAEKHAAIDKEATAAATQHVGTVDEWIDNVNVTIQKVVSLGEGDFGEKYMTIIKDDKGNTYNYFGWPRVSQGSEEEMYKQKYVMRAKIKKHYVNKNGIKVTVVGYPKFK